MQGGQVSDEPPEVAILKFPLSSAPAGGAPKLQIKLPRLTSSRSGFKGVLLSSLRRRTPAEEQQASPESSPDTAATDTVFGGTGARSPVPSASAATKGACHHHAELYCESYPAECGATGPA